MNIYTIDQPQITSKRKKGGLTTGSPDSHLILEQEGITIMMESGRAQHSAISKMKKGMNAILDEIKLENWRKSKDYQETIKT